MAWKLKPLDARPVGRAPAVGEVWPEAQYVSGDHADLYRGRLSQEYRTSHMGKRAPLVLRLPNGSDFVLDFEAGLRVSGEIGQLTVEGLIDRPGFKGYLRNGELLTIHEADKQDATKNLKTSDRTTTAEIPVQDEEAARATQAPVQADVQRRG